MCWATTSPKSDRRSKRLIGGEKFSCHQWILFLNLLTKVKHYTFRTIARVFFFSFFQFLFFFSLSDLYFCARVIRMEEPNQPQSQPDSSSTTISAEESRNGEFYGAASVSASVSQVRQEEQNQAQLPSTENEAFTCTISDDSFSCIIVIITFCFLGLFFLYAYLLLHYILLLPSQNWVLHLIFYMTC